VSVIERRATNLDIEACMTIARDLPEFFTDDVPNKVRQDLLDGDGWVITDEGVVVGFAVVDHRSARAVELLWMAVARTQRHAGLGTPLLIHLLDDLRRSGVELVEAKTLDRSANCPLYAATHAFWEHRGFIQIDRIDPLPGWRPGNPWSTVQPAVWRVTHDHCL
jgi:N-acetylglutamate synthase-like GNAT family acetyltransferase